MKSISVAAGLLCLFATQSLLAQNALTSPAAVSFYQLSYKPDKQARRFFDKGLLDLKRKKFQASIAHFQQALEIDRRYWAAENNLGYAWLKLVRPDRAQEAFERAVEIDPKNPIGYANLSVAALSRNDYRRGEQFARQALRLNPELSQAKGLLGVAEAGQGNWTPEAHRLLEEGRQYVPGSERLLRKWPRTNSEGPNLLVVSNNTH